MRMVSVLTTFVLACLMGGFVAPAGAKEVFKDEAGRVIYTIDDDGMV